MFHSYSKEDFINAVASSTSIRQVLLTLNVRPNGGNYKTIQKYITKFNLDTSHFLGQGWNKGNKFAPKRPIEDYLTNKQSINSCKLKARLISEKIKNHQCENCLLTEWNDKLVPLELHHVDGNHSNNNLINLQILCPNCHHQTPNFRNTKSKRTHSAADLNGFSRPKKQYFCIDCGKNKSRSATRCKSCSYKQFNKKHKKRPDKSQLIIDLLELNNNKSEVARKYSASVTSVTRWIQIYNIS